MVGLKVVCKFLMILSISLGHCYKQLLSLDIVDERWAGIMLIMSFLIFLDFTYFTTA